MEDELSKPIGTKEAVKLTAGSVIVQAISIEAPKEGSKAKLVVFTCMHPDSDKPIKMSNIKVKKVQGNNETIKKETLWYNLDDDGNIKKNGYVAEVMRFYNKKTLKEFEKSSINTETDANGYLCIKAY